MLEDRLLLSSFPNGSVNVAVVGGGLVINGGFLPESGPDLQASGSLPAISFTNLAPSAVTPASLASFDTVILNVAGSLGMNGDINNLPTTARQAIVNFVGTGHKLIITDSETFSQDYSWLPFAFKTSNPGAFGASGSATIVEENTLSSNNPSSPSFIDTPLLGSDTDAIGDANVLTTFNSAWKEDMAATNILGVTGPVQTYAEYSSGGSDTGLMIYNGMDMDEMAGAPNTGGSGQLREAYVLDLRQPFNPSGLPNSVSVTGINLTPPSSSNAVGGTATVTATITNQLGVPQPNVHVSFSITSGPNAGATGTTNPANMNTNASGQVTFTYTSNGTPGTDTIVAQFTNSSGQVIQSQPVTSIWTAPLSVTQYRVLFGSQSYNLIGSTRNDLPWQITGVQVVFSAPVTSGDASSLSGLTATGFSGLGTNTLTWTFSPITVGSFMTTLLGSGAHALKDANGNALGAGSGFAQNFKVLYGDYNDDGVVSSADLVGVYADTPVGGPYDIFADLAGDGVINMIDVSIARSRIGAVLS